MARRLRLLGIDLSASRRTAFAAGTAAASLWLASACGSDDDHAPLAGSEGGSGNVNQGGAAARGTGASSGQNGGGRGDGARDGGAGTAGDDGAISEGGAGGRLGTGGRAGGATTDGGGAGGAGGADASSGGAAGSGGNPLVDGGPGLGARCVVRTPDDDPWASFGRHDPGQAPNLARFGAVSTDELSVVWTTSEGDVYLTERDTNPGAFSGTTKINKVALAFDRAAMSPDGLVVMAVSKDRGSLVEYRRPTRSDAFEAIDAGDVALLQLLFEGGSVISEPVIGIDGASFYFLMEMPGGPPVLYESKWSTANNAWGEPHDFPNAELASEDASHRRRPTGASSDGRTLFFYDEIGKVERAAWRATPDSPFDYFQDIGDFDDAAPSPDCKLIYFTGTDGDGAGLFVGG